MGREVVGLAPGSGLFEREGKDLLRERLAAK